MCEARAPTLWVRGRLGDSGALGPPIIHPFWTIFGRDVRGESDVKGLVAYYVIITKSIYIYGRAGEDLPHARPQKGRWN